MLKCRETKIFVQWKNKTSFSFLLTFRDLLALNCAIDLFLFVSL